MGVYGYEKVKRPGFTVPYITYQQASIYGFIGGESVNITTDVPETRYLTVPDRTYNYATAEIMLSLYDGEDGELVFTVLDVYSSRGWKLETVARSLIRSELKEVLGYKKLKR